MIKIYSKVYGNNYSTEINYYFLVNNYAGKPYTRVSYELIDGYQYYHSEYYINFSFYIKHKEKIEIDAIRYTPYIIEKTRQKRRLSILTKFIFHIIVKHNFVNLYKSITSVTYTNNGDSVTLSPNAFIKSYYRLVPFFEQIYKP